MDAAVLESLLDEKLDEWVAEDLEAAIDERVNEAVASEVEAALESRLADAVESELEGRLESRIETAVSEALESTVDDRIEAALEAETHALEDRIDELGAEHTDAIEDVRDRVIQVKKEADAKASAEAHEQTRQNIEDVRTELSALDDRLGSLSDALSALEAETDDRIEENAEALEAVEADVADTEKRINTLAWNVNEIRDYVDTATDLSPILEKAAQLDIDRAKCDRCEAGIEIGLLTEASCPHCESRLTGVVDSRSFFGKPRLLVGDEE
jgi:chromosome segregation ATPase